MFDRPQSQTVHLHAQDPAYQYPPHNVGVHPAPMRQAPADWQPDGIRWYPARVTPQLSQNVDYHPQFSMPPADNFGQENHAN